MPAPAPISSPAPESPLAFVGRQAVYDRKLGVYGYELLFRSGTENRACFVDGDVATSQVLLSSFVDIGIERLCQRNRAFINLTRAFLVDQATPPFPPEQVVVEVLETVEPEAAVIEGLERLRAAGYVIALDDFCYEARFEPLIALADIIKIDVRVLDDAAVVEHVSRLKPKGLKLLAEKIETRAEFDRLVELGFDYFQGYFLSRPEVVSGKRLPQNKLSIIQLLARLQDPAVKIDEIERAVSQDVALSYKLLRCINSAFFALPRRIESIRHALVILGLGPLRRWIALLALAGGSDQPPDVVHTVMVRARMCELLGVAAGERDTSSCFTVGLFSSLDLLMGTPLPELLAELPLAPALVAALLERKGRLGEMLACVEAYEHCDWQNARLRGLADDDIRDAYVGAVEWAFEVVAGLG